MLKTKFFFEKLFEIQLFMTDQNIKEELLRFGNRLRSLRKHRKLTQIDLELQSGISNADISRIENGQKNLEIITVVKFARALKCETKELFDYDGKMPI